MIQIQLHIYTKCNLQRELKIDEFNALEPRHEPISLVHFSVRTSKLYDGKRLSWAQIVCNGHRI